LRFVSATTSQGSFTRSGGVITFSLGTLTNGQVVTATVTAQSIEDGSLTDTASVTSSVTDPKNGNNTDLAMTTVTETPPVVSAQMNVKGKKVNNKVVATFTHANGVEPASAFVATIDWGDNTTSPGIITLSGTAYSVKGSHTYANSGTHIVKTMVTEVGNAPNIVTVGPVAFPDGTFNATIMLAADQRILALLGLQVAGTGGILPVSDQAALESTASQPWLAGFTATGALAGGNAASDMYFNLLGQGVEGAGAGMSGSGLVSAIGVWPADGLWGLITQ
jgi:hypothetical protein